MTSVFKHISQKTSTLSQTVFLITPARLTRFAVGALLISTLLVSGCAMIADNSGTAPIGIESSDRSWSQVILDHSIENTAIVNLYKLDPRFKLSSRVNITSFHSVVLLTGEVPDINLKRLAEDNVKAMSDVKAVQNYLTVGDEIGYNQIIQDSLTTANVRKNFLLLKGFKDSRVKVVTENNVVYMMGKLPKSDIHWLIDTLQRTPNISKIVSLIDVLPEVPPTILPSPEPVIISKPLTNNSSDAGQNSPDANSQVVVTPVAVDPSVTSTPLQ